MAEVIKLQQHRERIYLYDNIKLIAIIMVVVGHAIDFLARSETGNHFEKSLFVMIYSVHMPLFIFISGLFLKPMNKDSKFPKDKVISFVAIGIVLRVFTAVVRMLLGNKPSFSILNMYDSYTWFMGAIAVFIALTWLLRDYDIKIILPIVFLVGLMAGYDNNLGDKYSLMRIAVFFPFFLVGYYLSPESFLKFVSDKRIKIAAVIVLAGFIAVCLFSGRFYSLFRPIFTGRNRYTVLGDYYTFGALFRAAAYLISAAVGISLFALVPNRSFGFLTSAGSKTLQIYFWHMMILITMSRFGVYAKIEALTGATAATVIYILAAVGITFLCTLPFLSFPTKQLLAIGKHKNVTP